MQNNRKNPRRRVSAPATLDSGAVEAGGVILDVSAAGARVRLAPGAFLANHCMLNTTLFSETVPCRVVWRGGAEVGLCFKMMSKLRQDLVASRFRWTKAAESSFGGGFGRRVVRA